MFRGSAAGFFFLRNSVYEIGKTGMLVYFRAPPIFMQFGISGVYFYFLILFRGSASGFFFQTMFRRFQVIDFAMSNIFLEFF